MKLETTCTLPPLDWIIIQYRYRLVQYTWYSTTNIAASINCVRFLCEASLQILFSEPCQTSVVFAVNSVPYIFLHISVHVSYVLFCVHIFYCGVYFPFIFFSLSPRRHIMRMDPLADRTGLLPLLKQQELSLLDVSNCSTAMCAGGRHISIIYCISG